MDQREYVIEKICEDCLSIPEWAKAEHMEMVVPQQELWKYSNKTGRSSRSKILCALKKFIQKWL